MARKADSGYSARPTPALAQLLDGEQRRRAELGDVGEHRDAHGVHEPPVLARARCTASGKTMSAPASTQAAARSMRGLHALDRQRVGARHDDEVVGAGVDRGLDAVDHLLLGNDGLARPVAAALGLDLVLDVHAGGAGAAHRASRCGRC